MSPERWKQIEEIFQIALDTAPSERPRYLEQVSAGDEELKREVEVLLANYEAAGEFIDDPVYDLSGVSGFLSPSVADETDAMVGRRVGAYRIVRELGRGGMGTVYLAERDDNVFRRSAAIKLIKRGMDTDFILRRFHRERQILAALDHQNIARILDGGSTEDGLPYFVMEYIEGEPLYSYCDSHCLDLRARLRLFSQICEAVEYAHHRQVIHRDLKPSNILVTREGAPKLFDFGIGKLLDPELASESVPLTATAMRLMTVEYASPEQVQGQPVTFASDIYSLGVLLYELLTGHRPYRFRNRSPHEKARVVTEESPELPSVVVSQTENFLPLSHQAHQDSESVTVERLCRARGITPEDLQRELSGSLDNITMKALRKDPSQRYSSAAALREDILRYLDGRPVSAPFYSSSAPGTRTTNNPLAAKPGAAASQSKSGRPPTGGKTTIAVLPFKLLNLRPDDGTGDEYLSIGLADALINRLSNLRRLIVRPTSSILRLGAVSPDTAGRELEVDFVIDGNVRRGGDRIRVTVQLLNVRKNSVNWSERFDECLTDVLELEDSISERVVKSLLPQLTGEEAERLNKRGTDSPAAYQAYLRGRYFATQFSEDGLVKSLEAYREAARLDPGYALPHVGIAEFYVWSAIMGALPTRKAYPQAKEELRLALSADDSLAEALALSAFITMLYDWDWPTAERLIQRALEINPNYYAAHDAYAHILASRGEFDQAVAEIRRAEELDPLSPRSKIMVSCITYQTRRFDLSAAKAEEAAKMEENSPQALLHLGNALMHCASGSPRATEALTTSVNAWGKTAMNKFMLCFALASAGRRDEAEQVLQEILRLAETQYVKSYFIAMAHVALGKIDEAFDWFRKSIEERDDWMLWFGTDIKLDPIRRDPRYFEILRNIGNPVITRQLPEVF